VAIYTYTTLDNPAATYTTQPLGINDAGLVVGIYSAPIIFSTYYSFLYSGGSYTTLSDPSSTAPNGSGTFAYGINASGQIVGYYQGRTATTRGSSTVAAPGPPSTILLPPSPLSPRALTPRARSWGASEIAAAITASSTAAVFTQPSTLP
jgi:hypothetical protein